MKKAILALVVISALSACKSDTDFNKVGTNLITTTEREISNLKTLLLVIACYKTDVEQEFKDIYCQDIYAKNRKSL